MKRTHCAAVVGLVALLASVSLVPGAYAQPSEDVVYLKNGGVIRGTILEIVPDQTVRIEIAGGSILVYRMDEVARITREEPTPNPPPTPPSLGHSRDAGSRPPAGRDATPSPPARFVSHERLGIQLTEGEVVFTVGSINGVTLADVFSIGAGLELNKYPEDEIFPAYLDLRADFLPYSPISPLFYVDAGYAIGDFGGLLLGLGVGINAHLTERAALAVEIGYRSQWSKVYYFFYYDDGYGSYYTSGEEDVRFDQITIFAGISF